MYTAMTKNEKWIDIDHNDGCIYESVSASPLKMSVEEFKEQCLTEFDRRADEIEERYGL